MTSFRLTLLVVLAGLSQALAAPTPAYRLVPAFPHLKFKMPVWLTQSPDGSYRLFVVEQKGKVFYFPDSSSAGKAALFLDLGHKLRKQNAEEGLLCLAFHPHFKENGYFYVYYIADNPHREVLSRFHVDPKHPNRADPLSEKVFLEIPKKFGNHNGSTLLFGPEGYLYFGLGDGGGAGDPNDNAQSLGSLWGKILRIDVDHQDPGLAYAIPQDNPFVGRKGARGEIWAYGLRNPWRMSFDRATGDLWCGDVGQDKWEEIDRIEKGGNYGWSLLEGNHSYKDMKLPVNLVAPVLEYPHKASDSVKPVSFTGICVTGGYVYRGSRLPELQGAYLYADYVLGWVRALIPSHGFVDRPLIEQPDNISSFGEDGTGEVFLLGYSTGKIYRLEHN